MNVHLHFSKKGLSFEKNRVMDFHYIVSDPEILGGKPIIRGSRISVQLILEWIASGASIKDIVEEFPHLPYDGVKEAILYASRWMENEIVIETKVRA